MRNTFYFRDYNSQGVKAAIEAQKTSLTISNYKKAEPNSFKKKPASFTEYGAHSFHVQKNYEEMNPIEEVFSQDQSRITSNR